MQPPRAVAAAAVKVLARSHVRQAEWLCRIGGGRVCGGRVCDGTLAYAASVSCMVLSYSFRDEILRARLSLMRASRSVRMRRSFWILAATAGVGGR